MNNQDDRKKELPKKLAEQPQQLGLLQTVSDPVVNTQSLRFWDSLVNAVFDDRKVVNRVAGKFLDSDMRSIEFESKKVDVLRYPARVGEWEDQKEVFPMKRDYKVLEALIKLAVDQEDSAFYSGKELVLSVRASYYKIYQVFKQTTGKASFSYKQIEEAIDVLSQSIVAFRFNDLEVKGTLISYITTKDEDLRQRSFLISFHPLISRLILNGSFREANLPRILGTTDMFTVFLYKKFVHNFKQASNKNHYHFSANSLLKEIPTVNAWKRMERKIAKINESLGKLEGDVVLKWESDKKYSDKPGRKTTVDCVFKVWFTEQFVDEQVKANAKVNAKANSKKDSVLGPDGQLIEYPNRNDYPNKQEYMRTLKAYHALKNSESNQIVERIFGFTLKGCE